MESDNESGSFTFLLSIFVLWLMWPVCWWVGLAGLTAWVMHVVYVSTTGPFSQAITKDLRDAAIAVAAGVGLVAVAQVLLQVFGFFASETTIKGWESGLVLAKEYLGGFLKWEVQVFVWGFLLAASFYTGWAAVKGYSDRRKVLSRLAIVLNTMASFTFFSAARVGQGEADWTAAYLPQQEAVRRVERLEAAQRELAAHALLETKLKGPLPSQEKAELQIFLRDAARRPASTELLIWKAERLFSRYEASAGRQAAEAQAAQEQATQVKERSKKAEPEFFETIVAEFKAWGSGSGPVPRMRDIRAFESRAKKVEHQLKESEVVGIELVKAALSGWVAPDQMDIFAKTVTKSLTGSITKTVFKEWYPKTAESYDQAREWVRESLTKVPEMARWEYASVPLEKPVERVLEPAAATASAGALASALARRGRVRNRPTAEADPFRTRPDPIPGFDYLSQWNPQKETLNEYIKRQRATAGDGSTGAASRSGPYESGGYGTGGYRPPPPPPPRPRPRPVR